MFGVEIEYLIGTEEDDILYATENTYEIDGKGGNDVIYGSMNSDYILDSDGIGDIYWGDAGFDIVDYSETIGSGIYVTLDDGSGAGKSSFGDTLHSIEDIVGTIYDDVIIGSSDGNIFQGSSGKDLIYGMGGDDYFLDDGSERDLYWGGTGYDTIRFSFAMTEGISVNLLTNRTDRGDYLHSIEHVIGTSHDDNITGDWADNHIYAGNGKDQLHGGGGNDIFFDTDQSRDLIWGGWAGSDTVVYYGSLGSQEGMTVSLGELQFQDWITAEIGFSSFDDYLSGIENVVGSNGDDILKGNYKSNIMAGMEGRDNLYGGDGADIYFYASAEDSVSSNNDILHDFETGQDQIHLAIDFSMSDIAISAYSATMNEVSAAGSDFSILVKGDVTLSDITVLGAFTYITDYIV